MPNTEIKTFKKATKKEFANMSVQERKDYLNRFYDFLHPVEEINNLKEREQK